MEKAVRTFIVDDITYNLIQPTGEDIRQADWHYAKMFSRALGDGYLTSGEILGQLKTRGVIGVNYETEMAAAQDEITKTLVDLQLTPAEDLSKRQQLAVYASKIRSQLYELNHRVNGPLSNSCENLAEDARLTYLTSKIIVGEDGNVVWKTMDLFLNDTRTGLLSKAKYEVMLWMQGLTADFISELPENKVLVEVRDSIMENVRATLADETASAAEGEQNLPVEEAAQETVPATTSEVNVDLMKSDSLVADISVLAKEEKPKKKRGKAVKSEAVPEITDGAGPVDGAPTTSK